MPDHESTYFRARAEDEILAAECAGHPDAARAHFLLAGYYLDLAYNPAARPMAQMDGVAHPGFGPFSSVRDCEVGRAEA